MATYKSLMGDEEKASDGVIALFKARKDSQDAFTTKMASKSANWDSETIWRDLGGARKEDAYEMRLTALTNPYKYAALRAQALESIKDAVKIAYQTAFGNLIQAGASKEYAQDHARKAAKLVMDSQEAQMRIRFPDEDTKVYTNKAARNADAFV
jgi:hypothetical protein